MVNWSWVTGILEAIAEYTMVSVVGGPVTRDLVWRGRREILSGPWVNVTVSGILFTRVVLGQLSASGSTVGSTYNGLSPDVQMCLVSEWVPGRTVPPDHS